MEHRTLLLDSLSGYHKIQTPLNQALQNDKEAEGKAHPLRHIPGEVLAEIQQAYDAGLCLRAWHLGKEFGPFRYWDGMSARVLAGRLAANLGGYREGQALHWLAWRSDKNNPDLVAYHGYTLLRRRGPLATLEFIERYATRDQNPDGEGLVHLFALQAEVLAVLRDFAESRKWLQCAAEVGKGHPWLARVEAAILELEDRYPEALEAARRSLEIRPWYRPGVQAVAHALQLLDRDEEALAFLIEANQHIENMHVARQLANLQMELGLCAEAEVSLARLADLAPLMERGERQWLARQRVALLCLRNHRDAALSGARQIEDPYYRELAERLQKAETFRRVRLDVPFVRQHHQTCAPATLSAISRFWGLPAAHLEVAEAICYDGTPAHSERHWAETHGWVAREFTVTWEAAVALLDRGIPFTLTTRQTTSAHLQAVVGYDEIRQTLWIRDPFVYYANEFIIKPLLEQQRATGPRGMAMVPMDRARLLEDLELPDADIYDLLHRVERALAAHNRSEAVALCDSMQTTAPGHRLTLSARRALASYDGNLPSLLGCLEQLLKKFPNDENIVLSKLGCLRELARREARLELLEQLCAKPETDPIFWQQYAQELAADARQHRAASSWMRWALRYRPTDPGLVTAWADLLWDQRQFAQATRFYRLAAGLGEKLERPSRSYFAATRHLREVEKGLYFLRARSARLSRKAAAPTITLVEALQHLRRTGEAQAALNQAMDLRPEDGELRLFAADFLGRIGQFEKADQLLVETQAQCAPAAWHRVAAGLAGYRNAKTDSLSHWRRVLEFEPLAHDAIRALTLLLAETEGRHAALAFLEEMCQRFPFSCPLLALRIQWSNEDGAEAVLPHVRRLLEVNPADAWAWREQALKLAETGKHEQALQAASHAVSLDPHDSPGHSVRGTVLALSGRIEEARAEFREAVRLEVDNEYAVGQLVATAQNLAERTRALDEVAAELRRQVIFGGALSAYQSAARGVLSAQQVLALLREAHQARPDLWQAWSVLTNELTDQGVHDDALRFAREATERFPLLSQLWVDMARVEHARLNAVGETAALEKAVELDAANSWPARQLAACYERQHELAKARNILEQAIAANPLEAVNHGCLANVLWKQGERDAALARLQHALRLMPGYDWGWRALREWGRHTNQPQLARAVAEDLTRCRGGEARSWLMLAGCLRPDTEAEQLFTALDRAIALNPRCEEAFDLRAQALAQLNRFEEALAQCAPPIFKSVPAMLLIRAAWIESQRGNLPQAIAKAKAALQEHPDYYGGWQLLSDWHLQSGQAEEAVQAAEKMVSLAPLAPVPRGYLGDLKLRLGEKQGAKEAFARAFALDPEYEYAGMQLFQLQAEHGESDQAEATVQILERPGPNPRTMACRLKLAVYRKEMAKALELFDSICASEDTTAWTIDQGARALDGCGQQRAVDKALNKHLAGTSVAPALAAFWVARQAARGHWRLHRLFRKLAAQAEARRAAVLQYLDQIGEAVQAARQKQAVTTQLLLRFHFHRFFREHQSWLRTDLEGWGKVGYVLTCVGRSGAVVDWLGDWKQRPNAESWMLYNLVIMLQRKGLHEQARDIIGHAAAMRHGQDLYPVFRLWAAFEEALLGNRPQARAHLSTLVPDSINDAYKPIQAMTDILLSLEGLAPEEKRRAASQIRVRLRKAFGETRPCNSARYARDGYFRFLRVASREMPWLRLWGWWYYRGAEWTLFLLLPLGLLAPPLLLVPAIYFLRRLQRG